MRDHVWRYQPAARTPQGRVYGPYRICDRCGLGDTLASLPTAHLEAMALLAASDEAVLFAYAAELASLKSRKENQPTVDTLPADETPDQPAERHYPIAPWCVYLLLALPLCGYSVFRVWADTGHNLPDTVAVAAIAFIALHLSYPGYDTDEDLDED
jgi:hypothetical protein